MNISLLFKSLQAEIWRSWLNLNRFEDVQRLCAIGMPRKFWESIIWRKRLHQEYVAD